MVVLKKKKNYQSRYFHNLYKHLLHDLMKMYFQIYRPLLNIQFKHLPVPKVPTSDDSQGGCRTVLGMCLLPLRIFFQQWNKLNLCG